jgi:short-subunit dehydrogenase
MNKILRAITKRKVTQKKAIFAAMQAPANKVVWITGASGGIGEALVHAFAKRGASVVLSSRNRAELERVQKEAGLNEKRSLVLPLDLGALSDAEGMALQVLQRFGRIDVLINNGGLSQRANAADTNLETDRLIMEVNYFGTIALTKAVLPIFKQQQAGQIVVISSIAGKFGFYLRSAYSASKHALHGFFESLRMEVQKENIRVLIVCPGKVRTNISMNAILGDGRTHSKMDPSTDQGVSAAYCAEKIIQGIGSGKEEIFVGGKELRAIWVKRFFPGLFSKLIKKQKPE